MVFEKHKLTESLTPHKKIEDKLDSPKGNSGYFTPHKENPQISDVMAKIL